jgi:hypothetical protein
MSRPKSAPTYTPFVRLEIISESVPSLYWVSSASYWNDSLPVFSRNRIVALTNSTLLSEDFTAHSIYTGQFFFDQDLISKVESTSPYNTNEQVLLTNAEDYLLFEEGAGMVPTVEYPLLGDNVNHSVRCWQGSQ